MLSTTLRLSTAFSFSALSLKFSTSVIRKPAVIFDFTPPSSTSAVLVCKVSLFFMLSTTLRLSTAFSFSVGRMDTFSALSLKFSTSVICIPVVVLDFTPRLKSSASLKLSAASKLFSVLVFATTFRLCSGLIFSADSGISAVIIFAGFSAFRLCSGLIFSVAGGISAVIILTGFSAFRLCSGLIFSVAGGVSAVIIFTRVSATGFVASFSFPCNP